MPISDCSSKRKSVSEVESNARSNAIVIIDSSDEINEEVIEASKIISPCISHPQLVMSSHKNATNNES